MYMYHTRFSLQYVITWLVYSTASGRVSVNGLSSPTVDRRSFVAAQTLAISSTLPVLTSNAASVPTETTPWKQNLNQPFQYSTEWTGTSLQLMSMEESVRLNRWEMGRWPDPILRRPANEVDPQWYGTAALQMASRLLTETARREGAVGLAAQQCGMDARLVYLEGYGVLVNPHIIRRSPETSMRVWQERYLVLPPTFVATVLRDDWVEVDYHTPSGNRKRMRLSGEPSRCVQHEMDHDRGILVTDHVGLEELESDLMRQIEKPGHDTRMFLAYNRQIFFQEIAA